MSESIPPLDPDILGALRGPEAAPADVRARARHRLMSAIGAGGGAGGGGASGATTGGAAGAGGSSRSLGRTAGLTALAFVLGGVAGSRLQLMFGRESVARVVYVDRVITPAPSSPGVSTSPAIPSAVPLVATNAVPVAAPAPPARGSQLSAERIVLDEARGALAQGDPARAIERLGHHRRAFPAPLLGEERDAMWVQALVKGGHVDEARAHAEAFRRRYPDSLFSSVVDSAIDSVR
ncbi:MAG TPA: hypothetical protein VH044_09410 [Polyangiaceae bacterium]|nr:hypothetical protein [Polyangiaceae bacterium]